MNQILFFCRQIYTKGFHPGQAHGGPHGCMKETGSKACSISFTTESGRRKSVRSQNRRGSLTSTTKTTQNRDQKTDDFLQYSITFFTPQSLFINLLLHRKEGDLVEYSELNESFLQDI